MGMLLLLLIFFVVGLTLLPLLQIAEDLLDLCGLQVMHVVFLYPDLGIKILVLNNSVKGSH